MFLYYSFFPPGCDGISPILTSLLGEEYHRPVGWAGVAVLAGIKLGISSSHVLVILRLRGKIAGSRIPFRIMSAATLVILEHFNLKDDIVT